MTTTEYMTTTQGESDETPKYWGFVAIAIAVFFYGITYAPVKKFDTGDGMVSVITITHLCNIIMETSPYKNDPRFPPNI